MSEKKSQPKENLRRNDSLNSGLLMVPTNVKSIRSFPLNHKRTGSTGTTGDESYTTDEEGETEDPDYDLASHKLPNFFPNDFGTLSGISTITDGIHHTALMHRNSSDISVYGGSEKCSEDSANSNNESTSLSEIEGDCKCVSIDWAKPASVRNVDSFTFAELRVGLRQAHRQLKARKEEVHKLSRIRQDVEVELEDLTASLFQEAHNMVREANEKQTAAERALKESEMKVEVLLAEVSALKTLVITSTPSSPNPHLHPQIDKSKDEGMKHSRSPSHSHLKYGGGDSSPPSPNRTSGSPERESYSRTELEIDPLIYDEFILWKEKPILDKTAAFILRVYEEDINLCLSFTNLELSEKVTDAVERGAILIESLGEKSKDLKRVCALMKVPKICSYRMNLGDENDDWYNISQICRNRITAVCDFLNYLKYIEIGLVKSSAQDMFHEIMRLRKNMVLGRMGFPTNS